MPLRTPTHSQLLAAGLALSVGVVALANRSRGADTDPPASAASTDAPPAPATGSFIASLKQAFAQDFDRDVVRGHFDVGTPPDTHRFYCLIDPKKGKSETNGVAGQPVVRPDGMTAIKGGAISMYSCASAEQQGTLVTTGYVLSAGATHAVAAAAAAQPTPKAAPATPKETAAVPKEPAAPELKSVSPDKLDIAGVKLGMSPDQVRSILKSKMLLDYHESMQTLGHVGAPKSGAARAGFVNVIAAWTPRPTSSAGDDAGESYEVMFTPVPGKERAMAIVHSMAYSPSTAVREKAFNDALVKKYGGFNGSSDLPTDPTWRIQSGGAVQVGDSCNRRGLFGGLSEGMGAGADRPNSALKTTTEEFRFQIENCGIAILTEDHAASNEQASRDERLISRYTVTAYSPSIGFEGAAAAAQLMQAAVEPSGTKGAQAKSQIGPNL